MVRRKLFDGVRLLPLSRKEIEVGDGVVEKRRQLLWLPASFFAASFLWLPKRVTAGGRPEGGAVGWDDFLKECVPVARELHKDSSSGGQDAYLFSIASMAARLSLKTIPTAKLGAFGGLNPPVEFGVSYRGVPFFVVEWRMAPGAVLPPHCHPNASVCTLGLEAEARIRNFEIVGQAPEFASHQSFLVRETHNEVIARGRVNTLSSTRDNIHTFRAGKNGARGIDISTLHGADVGFSFLDIAEKPKETDGRVYEAAWKGREV